MPDYYTFPCGCKFEIIGPPVGKNTIPRLKWDIENSPVDCKGTWDAISTGFTKGIFQLESQLGKKWSKDISPDNLDDMGAISALIRPGCLASYMGGKNMTQHFADRKSGKEEIAHYHDVVDKVLEDTYGILCYQESAMRLVQEIALFSEQEADALRKAIGKKLPEEMAKVKKLFLEKAKDAAIVSEQQAIEIFDWIEKSQRYSFNRSHAIGYAKLGYWTAYAKYHWIVYFLTAWLSRSSEKIEPHLEVDELVSDARMYDIPVLVPDFRALQQNFYTDGLSIRFGIGNVKSVGQSIINKILDKVPQVEKTLGKTIDNFNWLDLLFFLLGEINSKSVTSLINAGAFGYLGLARNMMCYELEKWSELTEMEQDWVRNNHLKNPFFTLSSAIESGLRMKKDGGAIRSKPRLEKLTNVLQLLKKPPYSLQDSPDRIAFEEKNLLGTSVTFAKIDACDIGEANTSCKELLQGKDDKYMVVAGEITKIKECTIKNGQSKGKKMAFVGISDGVCTIDLVAFNNEYSKYRSLFVEGNTVVTRIDRDSKGQKSLIVKAMRQC